MDINLRASSSSANLSAGSRLDDGPFLFDLDAAIDKKIAPQHYGGVAYGMIQRRKALERYYLSPNKCLFCEKVICVPDGGKIQNVRVKKFCSCSCAAKYNNPRKPVRRQKVVCPKCDKKISNNATMCQACRNEMAAQQSGAATKGDIKRLRKGYQSYRNRIRQHAVRGKGLQGPRKCFRCGYHHYVEVAHKKAVASFPASSTLSEINHPSNLVFLCPNCHWEFDHGMFVLE
jgi:5-methylcytosine-specific restriction endonuclease McrA